MKSSLVLNSRYTQFFFNLPFYDNKYNNETSADRITTNQQLNHNNHQALTFCDKALTTATAYDLDSKQNMYFLEFEQLNILIYLIKILFYAIIFSIQYIAIANK